SPGHGAPPLPSPTGHSHATTRRDRDESSSRVTLAAPASLRSRHRTRAPERPGLGGMQLQLGFRPNARQPGPDEVRGPAPASQRDGASGPARADAARSGDREDPLGRTLLTTRLEISRRHVTAAAP